VLAQKPSIAELIVSLDQFNAIAPSQVQLVSSSRIEVIYKTGLTGGVVAQ